MQPYQVIFSDMDGTLLNREHQISKRTKAAIRAVTDNNIPFILVSARSPAAMLAYWRELGGQSPMICYNGALILDAQLNILHSLTIPKETLNQLQAWLGRLDTSIGINYFYNQDWFAQDTSHGLVQQEMAITGCRPNPLNSPLETVHKLLLMGEPALILALEQQLISLLPQLAIYRSKPDYLEITPKQATKAYGVKQLLQRLNLTPAQAVAFGDNFNDLDMLTSVGLGVAMGNAPAQIKAQADWVSADNNADGIALVLERLWR